MISFFDCGFCGRESSRPPPNHANAPRIPSMTARSPLSAAAASRVDVAAAASLLASAKAGGGRAAGPAWSPRPRGGHAISGERIDRHEDRGGTVHGTAPSPAAPPLACTTKTVPADPTRRGSTPVPRTSLRDLPAPWRSKHRHHSVARKQSAPAAAKPVPPPLAGSTAREPCPRDCRRDAPRIEETMERIDPAVLDGGIVAIVAAHVVTASPARRDSPAGHAGHHNRPLPAEGPKPMSRSRS